MAKDKTTANDNPDQVQANNNENQKALPPIIVNNQYIRDFSYEKFPLYSIKSKEELYQLEKDFIHVHFNISKSFLYSFKLVQFEDGTGGFHVVVHHLISDAWSMSLLVSGIINLYSNKQYHIQCIKGLKV